MGNSVYDKNVALKLDDCIAPDDNTDRDVSASRHGLLPKLDDDASHCLNGDGSWATPPTAGYDVNYPRRTGNDAWYTVATCGGIITGSLSPAKDTMWALPFLASKTIVLDRIAVQVMTLKALCLIQLGIYNNGINMYPGSLLLNAGSVSGDSTGLKTITINQQLVVGNLYWLVCIISIYGVVLKKIPYNYQISPLGQNLSAPSLVESAGWSVAQKFGGLPSTFPAGGALREGIDCPAVFVRLSAA